MSFRIKKTMNRFLVAAILLGFVLTGSTWAIGNRADFRNINQEMNKTLEDMKRQCISYDEIVSADKAKSLIRVTEQAMEIETNLRRDPELFSEDYLREYIDNQRISGVMILNDKLEPELECRNRDVGYSDFEDEIRSGAVSDIPEHPEKIYAERIMRQGSYYDIAMVARTDRKGIICCYRYQDAEVTALNLASIENLIAGYKIEKGGIVYVVYDDIIHGSNSEHMRGKKAAEAPVIQELDNCANSSKPVRLKDGKNIFYGKKAKYSVYSLYIYYPLDQVFEISRRLTASSVGVYLVLCMLVYILQNREEKRHLLALDRQMGIIRAISGIYVMSMLIRLQEDQFTTIQTPRSIREWVNEDGMTARQLMEKISNSLIDPRYQQIYRDFTDLSTISERLSGKKYIESVYCTKAGVWLRDLMIPYEQSEQGEIQSVILVTRNIDEQKRLELEYQEKLKEATEEAVNANQAKTDFLRQMSHDVRTPINVIMGMVEIGNKHPEDMKRQQYCREKVLVAASMLLDLVNDVLFINKLDSVGVVLEEQPFDLRMVLGEIYSLVDLQAQEKNIDLQLILLKTQHAHLVGSHVHFRQIIMNIMTNAVKYTPKHGKIMVSCEEASFDDEKSLLRFVCADTGIGMSTEFQRRMFEPFAQEQNGIKTDYNGVGLGLAIVKKLVATMQGTIQVMSEKHQGTTFTIELPFKINHSGNQLSQIPKKTEEFSLDGISVLLVEDNKLNMEIAEFILEERGMKVTKAWNGAQAVEVWNQSEPGDFDIILMDLMMPEMNGFEAAREILATERPDATTIPIIAMSANVFKEDVEACKEAGMKDHIAKPLDIQRILNIIEKYVKK